MQRTQELIFALGYLDPLSDLSGHMRRLMVHAYGKCFGPRTMRLKESPFSDVLLCGQHNYEAVAARALSDAGVEVEFNTELTGLVQDGEGCTATFIQDGVSKTSRFQYVVGCDGAAGATKTYTKLNFEPKKTGVGIRQADCKLTWRRLSHMEQIWLFYFDQGFAVVDHLPGGVTRVITVEPKSAIPQREPTLAELETKLREVANDPSLTLTDPEWFSYTDLSMGHAPALRDDRILLAGDSGNPVLPNGGQGMNTGIADAFNLGWKLAALLRHSASEELLDTYNEERHALRLSLEKAQFNSLKYTTLVTPKVMQAAFRVFAEPLLNHGGEYKMAQAFSELLIDTRKSSLTLDLAGGKGIRAGDRALNAETVLGFESVRIYDLIYRGSWTLLAFSGSGSSVDATSVVRAIHELSRPVTTFIVSTDSRAEMNGNVLYDLDEEAHRVYGVTRPTLFLVRPDGHVGAKIQPGQIGQLAAYMKRWVPDATQVFSPIAAVPSGSRRSYEPTAV